MTDNEKKLRRTLEWLINLHEDAINKDGDYCNEICPVRDEQRGCPAEHNANIKNFYERDFKKCMELQVDYYTEKAQ